MKKFGIVANLNLDKIKFNEISYTFSKKTIPLLWDLELSQVVNQKSNYTLMMKIFIQQE